MHNLTLASLWGWVDSDWAADLDSRRSHTGYILMLTGGVVFWKSRRKDRVLLSTSEAEYVAASQRGQGGPRGPRWSRPTFEVASTVHIQGQYPVKDSKV